MHRDAIFPQAFSKRIEAARLLRAAEFTEFSNADALRQAADALDGIAGQVDLSAIASCYSAFADLIRVSAMLVEWRMSVLNATPESSRFLVGAKERCKLFQNEYANRPVTAVLFEVANLAASVNSVDEVGSICLATASVPLPIPFYAALRLPPWASSGPLAEEEKPQPTELSVAFVRFEVNGALANETHYLSPQTTHDLELEVRVSRWPDSATEIFLCPVTIEAATTYDFPKFRFSKPDGTPPYLLKQRGRAILNMPQSVYARPFEFRYTAEFLPASAEQPITVVGQRTLRIECVDVERSPLTGYPRMDLKILDVRNILRAQNLVTESELRSLIFLLAAFGNLSCQAIHDNLLPDVISEARFQSVVRQELRRRPELGSDIEEHPRASGGITDLAFRGIPIELKVANRLMSLDDCEQFVDQVVSYAVGRGKRAAILCVLDCSKKTGAPQPAESLVGTVVRSAGSSAVTVIVFLVQGNLARPSSLSR